jgi:hypothetical protein
VSRAELDEAVGTYARLRAEGWTLRTNRLKRLRDLMREAKLPMDEALFKGVDSEME